MENVETGSLHHELEAMVARADELVHDPADAILSVIIVGGLAYFLWKTFTE